MASSSYRVYVFAIFQIIILSTHVNLAYGTVLQNPSTAPCVGDRITIECALTPPDVAGGDVFAENVISFIIGSSDTPVSFIEARGNGIHDGFDLSQVTVTGTFGTSTSISGSITLLNFTNANDDLRIGCTARYAVGGNSGNVMSLIETVVLMQATPPSAPSLQSSVSNFNTATCSADISLSLKALLSDRTVDRYFLYLDGSPLFTTNSNSYIHSTILNVNTDYQYSVTAMSCAGNSTNSSANVISVASYSFTVNDPLPQCLSYNNNTAVLTVNWELDMPSQPTGVSGVDITYSLRLMYSHSREGVTYSFSDSTNFTQLSSQLSFNTLLTAHNFTQLDGVETNLTAHVRILQQCGQDLIGAELNCSFSSDSPLPISIPTPTPIASSSTLSSVSSLVTTTPTSSCNTIITSSSISTGVFPLTILFGLLILIAVIIIAILILVIIFMARKIKQLNSALTVKPAPSHPYEYIDLDKMSGNISSPTQQQSPQDYVPMSSVHKQDPTQPPTFYANLK